jgi:hypothetical protein
MNRIALLLLVLLVAALAILLFFRSGTGTAAGPAPMMVRRQPDAALAEVKTLLHGVRDGAVAAEQARKLLQTIMDEGIDPDSSLEARRRLAELEQLLGNHTAAGEALLDAIQAHPGHEATPELLFELGLLLDGPLDRPDEAREVFTRVAHLYPGHALAPEATIRLARICMAVDSGGRIDPFSDVREFSLAHPNHPLTDEAMFLVEQFATEPAEHE